jgi:murein tripeptide amidase MpaA
MKDFPKINSPIKIIEIKQDSPNKIIDLNKEVELERIDHENFEKISYFEKFEKSMELGFYLNTTGIFPKLIFLRSEANIRDQKIDLENIVNLKKKDDEITTAKNKVVKPYYKKIDEKDTTLIFESRFESGNLLAAYKISEHNYQLVVQNDTNTNGYSQWFFYRVSGGKKGSNVHFNIINLMKGYSLFNRGMKISVYSEKHAEKEKIGWLKGGNNIDYYKNGLFKYVKDQKRSLSSLSFTYEFEYENDTVYFANTIPYTYTDIFKELNEIQKNDKLTEIIHRKILCTTLAGNNCDYITITNPETSYDKENFNNKLGVVIMARVHPGETVGSFMMKGIIDYLCAQTEEANILRNNCVFKIVPMMNPDGVVCGNYRTSLAGCDLNRRWINPNEILHPEIFAAQQMILKFSTQRQIGLILDLHGHSGANNIFTYGNPIKENTQENKILPLLLSKLSDAFNYEQCKFKLNKNKYGTARINLFHELAVSNIFTIEASFYGVKREVKI